MPLLCGPPVRINGCRLYDGGLLSPLPVELAAADGATHILVLRTRPDGSALRRHAHIERAMLGWLHHAHPETRSMPVVPGGRYERQLATLPAGITAHGDAQVQVIVPHALPMSQSEMSPSALRAGAWTGLTSVERVVGERIDRRVLTRTGGGDRRRSESLPWRCAALGGAPTSSAEGAVTPGAQRAAGGRPCSPSLHLRSGMCGVPG